MALVAVRRVAVASMSVWSVILLELFLGGYEKVIIEDECVVVGNRCLSIVSGYNRCGCW